MKKTILTIAIVLGASSMFAQTLVNKKGVPYLPSEGSWGIGIDATPIFNYLGNMFGKTANNSAPTWNYLTGNDAITGKYFLKDNMAVRGALRLGFTGDSEKNMVGDRTNTDIPVYPELPKEVQNAWKHSGHNVAISAGLEWRQGKGRLQGFYGGEFGFGVSGNSDKYTYGNTLDPMGTPGVFVSGADALNGGNNLTTDTYGNAARTIKANSGSSFAVGLRAFVGAEYFVAPQISLAGEFGWGIVYAMNSASKTITESIDVPNGSTDPIVGQQEIRGSKSSRFGVDNSINNQLFGIAGKISINFYF